MTADLLMIVGRLAFGRSPPAAAALHIAIPVSPRSERRPQCHTHNRGTGLGLPISKGIVEAHGGRIGFGSDLGISTQFLFAIPR
jgi:hypothetical protein